MRRVSKRALAMAGASTAALIAGLSASAAGAAPALPGGGHVVAGQASIGAAGAALTVEQTSAKAIIDWSSFSIGQGGAVAFDNGSGATLNRVTGGLASSIDGRLTASGSVYLINPNGVIVGRGGVVQSGGAFVASTQDLADARFLAGGALTFAGTSTAQVVNLGKVGSLGGDVALIATTVSNRGRIEAQRGDVGLAAGYQVTLRDRLLDDGKFAVVLGGPGTSATNTGAIQAAEAELRANGGNVYALAGNAGGIIQATGVRAGDGKVLLVAEGGRTVAHGEIDATAADGSGGQVETSGTTVDFDGLSVRAGNWLVDPYNLTVNAAAAATISHDLASTDVTLQTTATGASGPGVANPGGAGDIVIAAPISWSSSETLELDAYRSIDVKAAVTAAGAGKVVLVTDDGGTGGALSFNLTPAGFTGSLSFTGAPGSGQALTINGAAYTLLYSMADLANVDTDGLGGDYALAASLDANAGAYSSGVIGVSGAFTGNFTGLGHTISGLDLLPSGSSPVGLFADASGTISGIGLVGAKVSGGGDIGILAGYDTGAIANSYATGAVLAATGAAAAGGLVGYDAGAIASSFASASVRSQYGEGEDNAGGLVGEDFSGSITDSYATGAVGSASDSSPDEEIGGLVGFQSGGTITASHATGAVAGGDDVGGLVGGAANAIIARSYATGAARGAATSYDVGGLVGADANGSIADSYATGAASGTYRVGGLAGYQTDGKITNDYAAGRVTGTAFFGGVVGLQQGGSMTNAYYDIDQVLIDGAHRVTPGGLYDAQFQDWLSHGMTLSISNYFGTPDANDYYSITDLADLENLLGFAGDPGLKFKLTADIDLSSAPGFYIPYFAGAALDGQGFTISNISLDLDNTDLGFIGVLRAGSISNLGVVGGSVVSGKEGEVGGLVGDVIAGSITNAYATDAVRGSYWVGGLVGLQEKGAIDDSYATGDVSTGQAGTWVGGLVGDVQGGKITGSYATGDVSGGLDSSSIGGLVGGDDTGSITITDSYATGAVSGSGEVGGLVGWQTRGTITGSHATGAVDGAGDVGGLVGDASGTISGSYATGAVKAQAGAVGGLVGASESTITDSYAEGEVSASSTRSQDVGGLVGVSEGAITDSYATGAVKGGQYDVGGLVGRDFSAINGSYATGSVSSGQDVGGLVGAQDLTPVGQDTISDSFATGAVAGQSDVGGLVGLEEHRAVDDYATGAVKGSSEVGGLVGALTGGVVADAYATGAVKGASDTGGLVGLLGEGAVGEGQVVDGYYDADTTGQPLGAQADGSTGLTTAQLQGALPTGFNASVWATGPGLYPYLKDVAAGAPQAGSGK